MIHLENENLNDLIKEGVHLLDFYADWCGPCKMLMPVLEEVSSEVSIIKINVDVHPDIANDYKVMSIPTLFYIKDGEVKSKSVGFDSKENILKTIRNL